MRQPALVRSGSRALRCLCLGAALLAPCFARAQSSPPAETSVGAKKTSAPPEPKTAPEAGGQAAGSPASTPDRPAPAESSTAAPAPEKGKPDSPAFVDRDGDGIQDGQEHRFRHRKSAGKHRSGAGTDSGGARARERAGQEDGQKQRPGGR